MDTTDLRPGTTISRVIRGNWQLAGGHGAIDRATALDDLLAAFDSGVTTFDCADIYTGVEVLLGEFRRHLAAKRGREAADRLRVHTKLVPDLDLLPRLKPADLEAIVDQSRRRLGVERLDLVQFHWWDMAVPGAVEAMLALDGLRRAGKLSLVGATNFDTPQTRAILEAGVPLVSMQTQYSLLDARPEHGLAALCQSRDVALLCYGTVAGGFLSDAWLGRAEPGEPLENRSLTKYKLIIEDFGGWALFQALLRACRTIADRHGSDIATVASRAVLDRPGVAAVIVGGRNGAHVAANAAIGDLRLSAEDHAALEAVLARRTGPLGDTYALERDRTGRHGRVMKYNLNSAA
ncbi:aldo/keto reductase [Lichenihabitans sp. Uapishka_5]|uniref:aldo/keto reductase n=1 Tax=Lichenihabitans sp. Uapishka_5 TaxID=3037302 RepID=UPI0029E7E2B3|nr:aldo/keto reductase [Lichenihabitans sp. Uapishka_5]MDX7950628.1 aldo/keto reductase [Lichenihabitans sp. Uapishka_5]